MSIQTKTLSVRVKDKHAKVLKQMAFEVNQVFNYANELTMKANRNYSGVGAVKPVWLSAFDVQKMTSGIQKERGFIIDSATVQEIIAIHAKSSLSAQNSAGVVAQVQSVALDLSRLKAVLHNGKMVK